MSNIERRLGVFQEVADFDPNMDLCAKWKPVLPNPRRVFELSPVDMDLLEVRRLGGRMLVCIMKQNRRTMAGPEEPY